MKKIAIIINGAGGVGKDTLCDMAKETFSVFNVSSITPIKEIAKEFGWNGEKTDKARKFLSDLKALSIEYNDFPCEWVMKRYEEFLKDSHDIMFIHIREGEEIQKVVDKSNGAVKTLLIRGGERMKNKTSSGYGNHSDDDVENYTYDFYFDNDKSLEEIQPIFTQFLCKIYEKHGFIPSNI